MAEHSFLKNVYHLFFKELEELEITLVYKNLKPHIILHGPPKCLFKCPHKAFLWLSCFSVLGLNWQMNSDCPPFGALAFLSCCSSGSQIFFLAKRIIVQHQLFLYSSLPRKEPQNSEEMYSRPQLWRLQHSRHWYLLYCFSIVKVSSCFCYLYFSCWALFSGRHGSCFSKTQISLTDLPWLS